MRISSPVIFDMVEAWGSSPHGPTIFSRELTSPTAPGKAPIGSIKEAVRDCRGHFLIVLREDTGPPDAPLTGNVRRTYESSPSKPSLRAENILRSEFG